MNIWLLTDGKKNGPHHDFEVRSMINNKDLEPEVMAWHEGMGEWKMLGEMPLFEDQFQEEDVESEGLEEPKETPSTGELLSSPQPQQAENIKTHLESLHAQQNPTSHKRSFTAEGEPVESLYDGELGIFLWRRFFARALDVFLLFSTILLVIILFKQQNPFYFLHTQQGQITTVLLWGLYDTLFIYAFGTTIGKAILGVRIESYTGSNLGLMKSIIRAAVVTLVLTSSSAPILGILMLVMCIFFAKLRKRLPWDLYASSAARALPLTRMRIISVIIVFFVVNILFGALTPKSVQEDILNMQNEMFSKLKK